MKLTTNRNVIQEIQTELNLVEFISTVEATSVVLKISELLDCIWYLTKVVVGLLYLVITWGGQKFLNFCNPTITKVQHKIELTASSVNNAATKWITKLTKPNLIPVKPAPQQDNNSVFTSENDNPPKLNLTERNLARLITNEPMETQSKPTAHLTN